MPVAGGRILQGPGRFGGMDESYGRCRTCRLCAHSGDVWACVPESRPVGPDGGCPRYRPGCCGACALWHKGVCSESGEPRDSFDFCSSFDPAGSFREPPAPVLEEVLHAGLGGGVADDHPLGGLRYPEVHHVVAQRDVARHRRAHPGVCTLQPSDHAVDLAGYPVHVRIEEAPGVDEALLRQERVVRAFEIILLEVVDRVHQVHGGGELREHLPEVGGRAVARDLLQRRRQALPESPPHGGRVPAPLELQIAKCQERLSDGLVVLREVRRRLGHRVPEHERRRLRADRGPVDLVVVELPLRQYERVRGHLPQEAGVRLGRVQDAQPPHRGPELQAVGGQAVEQDRVERHVEVQRRGPREAVPRPELVAALAVVPPVQGAVRRGQPPVGRDRVSEHRTPIPAAAYKPWARAIQRPAGPNNN